MQIETEENRVFEDEITRRLNVGFEDFKCVINPFPGNGRCRLVEVDWCGVISSVNISNSVIFSCSYDL
jgi:hypothetical protein